MMVLGSVLHAGHNRKQKYEIQFEIAKIVKGVTDSIYPYDDR